MPEFTVNTAKNKIVIEYDSKFIHNSKIKLDKPLFCNMCKECRNYNKKYSCPIYAPDFNKLSNKEGILVVIFLCKTANLKSSEYNKVRLANSIMKSRMEKIMRHLEEKFNTKFLGTGACRLCKPCKLTLNQPCKHPDKLRFSLEAVGVDCNNLSTSLFNKPLLWYKDKKAPDYTCVLSGLICQNSEIQEIQKEISLTINSLQ